MGAGARVRSNQQTTYQLLLCGNCVWYERFGISDNEIRNVFKIRRKWFKNQQEIYLSSAFFLNNSVADYFF